MDAWIDLSSLLSSESKHSIHSVEGGHPLCVGESVEALSRVHTGYLIEGYIPVESLGERTGLAVV